MDQPDLLGTYARWHAVTAPRGAMLLGEVNITDPGRLGRHSAGRGLDAVFWFGLIEHRWEPIASPSGRGRPSTVPRSRPRAPSRYGGGTAGRRRALTLATVTAGLPCFPFLYQGDEYLYVAAQLLRNFLRRRTEPDRRPDFLMATDTRRSLQDGEITAAARSGRSPCPRGERCAGGSVVGLALPLAEG
jgi:hypothetical protein